MRMQMCELKCRASMVGEQIDPIWAERYRIALKYSLNDPVDLDWVDNVLASETGVTPDQVTETWRDRAIREPLL